jgi:hypothetical protein
VLPRPSLLLVTDLAYPAQGRRYGDEDVWLGGRLRDDFDVALCSPLVAAALVDRFDLVLVRNSGPVLHHQEAYEALRRRAAETGTPMYNPASGKGDMRGKAYLVELSAQGFPVIPTVDRLEHVDRLPATAEYVVKPVLGADSIGLTFVRPEELPRAAQGEVLVQPRVDFAYEVSFVFVDRDFSYALSAPDPAQRWQLAPYAATDEDLVFAQRFVDWNDLDHGISRVDACRTRDGGLLLVELEDLNPYLSLDLLDEPAREVFVAAVKASLHSLLAAHH